MFEQAMGILQKGLIAWGTIWVIWGIITLAGGMKDKTAPEIKQGLGTMVGGAMVLLAAALVSQVTL